MKLKSILEDIEILKPRRSSEERQKNYTVAIQRQIQNYIKNGCVGDLDLNETSIERLPDNLKKVGGGLYLDYSKIKYLPDNLVVNGDLSLSDSEIKQLPDNLVVGRDLFLSHTSIETLPKNLKVGRTIYSSFSKIEELPDDLVVGQNVWLIDTPISKKYSKEQMRRIAPQGIKGEVIIKF